MTTKEFSDGFDTLLDSYSASPEFGSTAPLAFDEYEKSVFLTNAQEEIIIEIYTGKNQYGDSLERTEEIRRYLSNLVKTFETSNKLTGHLGLSKSSMFFQIPEDVWFITYESAVLKDSRLGCLDGEEASITPVAQDDFYRVYRNPFRGPGRGRALRLDINDGIVEIVSDYNIDKYLVRYLSRPTPIILVNLPSGLSINGVSTITECELNPVIHRAILERAVRLAIISRNPQAGSK